MDEPALRAFCLTALASLDESASYQALTEMLKDQDVELRLAAVYAISAVGLTAPTALPALQQAQRDREERVRQEATQAIRKLEAAGIAKDTPVSSWWSWLNPWSNSASGCKNAKP